MRIPIRVQLGSIILLSSLIGLAVISIAVWITTHNFVLALRASRLAVTASLKASQLSSNLDLMQTSATAISTRVTIQNAFQRYYATGNNTEENWMNPQRDIQAAISLDASLVLQARLWGRSTDGPGSSGGLLNVTADSIYDADVPLPGYFYPNGSAIPFGANDTNAGPYGYPPALYPNLTYFTEPYNNTFDVYKASYEGRILEPGSPLLLGPWSINSSLSVVSLTVPIANNTNKIERLGYLTVVLDSRLIMQVTDSLQGLGSSGETLLLGPASRDNLLDETVMNDMTNRDKPKFEVRYVVPVNATHSGRKLDRARTGSTPPFAASDFPTIYRALSRARDTEEDAYGSNVRATNEAGEKVSVGYATIDGPIVDWIVIVEQTREEVWQPITQLRNVIIACLFATAGLMAIISFPLAHFASLPIIRLKQATLRSMDPPSASRSSFDSFASGRVDGEDGEETADLDGGIDNDDILARKEGLVAFANPLSKWRQKRSEASKLRRDERKKRVFRIPGKVKERKHWIRDELSELTQTFNEMSDELMMQYTKLEERVQQRTRELELSKKAAEAANESKTLFIANLSHELKTPLNGILGLSAVCMQEDDPLRLKRSLGIIYKSGDLLLHLLNDLLTFSKNQVGQQISLDEKEFRLRDISSQILAIFEKQAREGQIDLHVEFEGIQNATSEIEIFDRGPFSSGSAETGRLRDMILWGDIHRLLQVVINLVSNSLKFTPPGGSVVLTVRCLPEVPPPDFGSSTPSVNSRPSRHNSSRHRISEAHSSTTRLSTANAINAKDKPHAMSHVIERAQSPPPGRYVYLEFAVADTGPGIPESMQDKIFEPFVQGDLGLSKKYGGTGLGLSICSQLASLMRGTINVRSTVGVGSTFTMKVPLRLLESRRESSATSLADGIPDSSRGNSFDEDDRPIIHGPVEYDPTPVAEHPPAQPIPTTSPGKSVTNDSQPRLLGLSQPFFASSQPMESPNSQPAAMNHIQANATRGERIRVLVAEDNKVNQEVVLRMLKLEDIYDVTVAKDGQEALDLVKESMSGDGRKAFNLIFMDVQMPNVDGLQSTRLIREIGYQAPIVALTAFAEESNIKDCLDSGMNYFLSKPIRRPQLKKVLKEYCAPIPEENEEVPTPSDDRRGSGANTTIVMVNGAPAETGSGGNSNGKAVEGGGLKELGVEVDHVEIKKDGK